MIDEMDLPPLDERTGKVWEQVANEINEARLDGMQAMQLEVQKTAGDHEIPENFMDVQMTLFSYNARSAQIKCLQRAGFVKPTYR